MVFIEKKIWFFISMVLAVLMIGSSMKSCNDIASLKNEHDAVVSFLEKEKDQLIKDNELAASDVEVMEQNMISMNKAIELLGNDIKKYKSIDSYVKAEMKTQMNNILVEYIDDLDTSITVSINQDGNTYMRVPRPFEKHDQWSEIHGMVTENGVVLDSISFLNKLDVTVGYKKEKWYKKSEPVVEMKSYNPYTSIPYLNNVVVKQPKSHWLLSKPAMFVYGIATGLVISK